MESKSLYAIGREYEELYEQLAATADEETGEVNIEVFQAVEEKGKEFEEKVVSCGYVLKELEEKSEAISAEIKRLTAWKKRLENGKERLKELLAVQMQRLGYAKVEGIKSRVSVRRSERTVVDNIAFIPTEYTRTKVEPDLTAIKEALKSGKEIEGAHLETSNSLIIK